MTSHAAGEVRAARNGLAQWCGWVLIGGAALVPLLGWLGPMGLAPLVGLMGLLSLPAVRMTDEDRPALIVLLGVLVWAAVSTSWSPYHPSHAAQNTALKLAFDLPLCWAAVCGARRADPRLRAGALSVLTWGLALLGLLLLVEAATGGVIYRALHERYYEPIRIDLAQKNLAQDTFVLAVLWPVVMIRDFPRRWEALLMLPAVAGTVVAAHVFLADAPVLAAPLAILVALAVWRWPGRTPKVLAAVTAAAFILMPAIVWAVRASGDYGLLEHDIPLSWAMRMGYWSHAIDWIADQPLRGWGLDASRMMGPGIQLHPHNDELQVWLELGVIGALAGAAFWWLSLSRLSRRKGDWSLAGAAASAMVYLLFATLNFGAWQEWWLALGTLVPVIAAMSVSPAPRKLQ